MKPVYASLRVRGHIITGYIDDTLLVADTVQELQESIDATTKLLEDLGFCLNYEKSVLTPTTRVTYLGFCIDSKDMTVSLNEDKVTVIVNECKNLFAQEHATIRNVSKVIGMVVAAFPGVQYGPLHYRSLERQKTRALQENQGNYDRCMKITKGMKSELQWWIINLPTQSKEITRGNPQVIITTDASDQGWGATCQSEQIGGRWSSEEKQNHINFQELSAVDLALKAFEDKILGKYVQLLIDNTTAVAYINSMGGRQEYLNELANDIWTWAVERAIWLSASHIPGVQNVQADHASRHFNDRTEWSLHDQIFAEINNVFGPVQIDLFASRLNAKCQSYVSWKRDPSAEYVDAFSRSWQGTNFYMFPPFSLIGRCIQKVRQDHASGVIVVPIWPTQNWFSGLLGLLVQNPILLPQQDNTLLLPGSNQLHPLRKKLKLIAAKISGKASDNSQYLRKLSASCCQHGSMAHTNSTMCTLKDGSVFVHKNKLIKCNQMCLKF